MKDPRSKWRWSEGINNDESASEGITALAQKSTVAPDDDCRAAAYVYLVSVGQT